MQNGVIEPRVNTVVFVADFLFPVDVIESIFHKIYDIAQEYKNYPEYFACQTFNEPGGEKSPTDTTMWTLKLMMKGNKSKCIHVYGHR